MKANIQYLIIGLIIVLIIIIWMSVFVSEADATPNQSNCTCQVLKEQNRILNKIERHMRDAQKH